MSRVRLELQGVVDFQDRGPNHLPASPHSQDSDGRSQHSHSTQAPDLMAVPITTATSAGQHAAAMHPAAMQQSMTRSATSDWPQEAEGPSQVSPSMAGDQQYRGNWDQGRSASASVPPATTWQSSNALPSCPPDPFDQGSTQQLPVLSSPLWPQQHEEPPSSLPGSSSPTQPNGCSTAGAHCPAMHTASDHGCNVLLCSSRLHS